MKLRNPFTLKARQRKGGPMRHRNAPRGGERQAAQRELAQLPRWEIHCARCGELFEVEPARAGSTEVQRSASICERCRD
jgi:hypothetical protein